MGHLFKVVSFHLSQAPAAVIQTSAAGRFQGFPRFPRFFPSFFQGSSNDFPRFFQGFSKASQRRFQGLASVLPTIVFPLCFPLPAPGRPAAWPRPKWSQKPFQGFSKVLPRFSQGLTDFRSSGAPSDSKVFPRFFQGFPKVFQGFPPK